MTMRMLIDARHREETRVAVVKGTQIEEFDFESTEHKQLKGNIYLAKVTRVEPSLQAAFIEYGGNRHGFLAFSEIHPDYYQIPREDRERLLREEAEAAAEEAALREQEEDEEDAAGALIRSEAADEEGGDLIEVDTDTHVETIDMAEVADDDDERDSGEDMTEAAVDDPVTHDAGERRGRRGRGRGRGGRGDGVPAKAKASDEARAKRMNLRRRYKIQDVIHRRQVLLVQVVKEERGNKGAALTTYLSLAGRYCVLMPNTSHGGGISRKISSAADRKRLKSIISDLSLPATMGCIIRTAGLQRTKPEIKRDFDYLARLWDEIRERTLKASAPQLIHSDSDLIKRAIRDIYNRDIDEVLVEGDAGYKAAKDFMRLLMPSHAKRVQHYADTTPLFQRYHVEDQLQAMYQPVVQLKSGGYIVINPTEALVSIDINSGRSTKEHGIEATAVKTNLEAAQEIARQLRLRDMAGLVVIDFIDMESNGNARKVEKAMKEALKNDRARIQVGRISSFGLMEMSRQRLRTGVLEASTRACPHCEGTGLVRTASSSGLSALRLIEEEAARGRGSLVTLYASQEATIYVLNNKRAELADIEARYGVSVAIVPNGEVEGAKMTVSASGPRPEQAPQPAPVAVIDDDEVDDIVPDEDVEDEVEAASGARDRGRGDNSNDESRPRRKRRRRGRRGGRGRRDEEGQRVDAVGDASDHGATSGTADDEPIADSADVKGEAATPDAVMAPAVQSDAPAKPRRTRRARGTATPDDTAPDADNVIAVGTDTASEAVARPRRRTRKMPDGEAGMIAAEEPVPATKPRTRRRAATASGGEVVGDGAVVAAAPLPDDPLPESVVVPAAVVQADNDPAAEGDQPARKGWWQRTFG